MAHTFNHLPNATAFPNIETVDPYAQYRNTFDYSRWKPNTKIKLLNVPWDNAGIARGNVVKFESDEARDSWFDAQTGATETLTVEARIQVDKSVRVPIPFDVAQGYNYLMVEFGIATSEIDQLSYETTSGIRRFYFFIDETRYHAASTTECILTLDMWMTYINHVTVNGMTLARGHAPMKLTTVDKYLSNPLENSSWLLAPEPDAMDAPYKISATLDQVLNTDVWAVIITTADLTAVWGSEAAGTWTTPTSQGYLQAVPASRAYAINKASLANFLTWCDVNRPQFIQTIAAVCFVGTELLATGEGFRVGNYTLYPVAPVSDSLLEDIELTQDDFGYDESYANIPKLYTSPYCMVRLVTSTGEAFDMAVENMGSRVAVDIAVSLIDPECLIAAHINGYGSNSSSTLTFSNITTSMRTYRGRWNDLSWSWTIPCYSLTQSARKHNEYADFYGRVQATNDYETAYQVANANAETAKMNADASANTAASNAKEQAATNKANSQNSYTTAKQNAYNAADTGYTNATNSNATAYQNALNSADAMTTINSLTVAANNALTANSQQAALDGTSQTNLKIKNDTNDDIDYSQWALDADIASNTIASSNNDATANMEHSNLHATALQQLLDLQIGSALFTEFRGEQNISTSWGCTNASINVALSNSKLLFAQGKQVSLSKASGAQATNNRLTEIANNQLSFNNNNSNSLMTSATSTNVNVAKSNALNAKNTADTNANNTKVLAKQNADNDFNTAETNTTNAYNRAIANADATLATALANNERSYTLSIGNADRTRTNAKEAIANGIEQASMAAPLTFGRTNDAASGVVSPMFVSWQIMRQPDDVIATVGDSMLRFGYACNRRWKFEDFNVMEKFTYWEVSDLWMTSDPGVIEAARVEIKSMLYNGVTVWRTPEDIGKVTIYDN